MKTRLSYLIIVGLAVASPVLAAGNKNEVAWAAEVAARAVPRQVQPQGSAYDRMWKFAELYNDESNPTVQNVLFTGRFQYEFAGVDGDEGSHDEWNVRRLRLGARSRLFNALTLHGEVELNPQERDLLYKRVTDLYVQWSPTGQFALTVGKQSVPFTVDGATSSKELLTIDRSNLANNMWFPEEYMPGFSVSGRIRSWIYRTGIYSAGGKNREFGTFDGSMFTLAVLGYDFGDSLGVDEALLAANYVYQNPDLSNTFARQLQHVVSVNFRFEADDRWGARADVTTASGYGGQSDVWGLMAMPFFNVTDRFQVVGRYTLLNSDELNGVRLARYETSVVSGRGDRYNEGYFGANYYFYGHKLKLQGGLQFADMNDGAADGGAYSGVAFTSGLRLSW